MDKQIQALRERIDGVPRGPDGRRTFTAAIRKDAIALASKWVSGGHKLAALADALSLHKTVLRAWVNESAPQRKRVRAVRVVQAERKPGDRSSVRGNIVALFPSGLRIEGLTISDVIELASAVR